MTTHVPVEPGSLDYCAAFDRCDLCRAPIDLRGGTWVTLVGGRAECPGRYLGVF